MTRFLRKTGFVSTESVMQRSLFSVITAYRGEFNMNMSMYICHKKYVHSTAALFLYSTYCIGCR